MFSARILADSINVVDNRLTTYELIYPEFIHNELLTHRMLSRNAMSSRAIPTEKLLKMISEDPVIPIEFGRNQKGMQAGTPFEGELYEECLSIWIDAAGDAIRHARDLAAKGVHKQIVNRILGPYKWINVIASATDWWHFFNLRAHPMAEPHMIKLASWMLELYDASVPQLKQPGEWHLPLIYSDDVEQIVSDPGDNQVEWTLAQISAGRCARVSYLTHHGTRDHAADIALAHQLSSEDPMHASPLEHPAQAMSGAYVLGNYTGWSQLRKMLDGEYTTTDRRLTNAVAASSQV